MLLSFAQAIVIAAEDWIKDSITDRERYYETCGIFAKNSEEIDILIAKTYEYGFTYTSNDRSIKKAHPVTAFEGCLDKIDRIPNIFSYDNSTACKHYRNGSEINKRQAQLAQSRYYHVVGNVEKAKSIITKIENQIKDRQEENNFFDSTVILFEVESMMSKFYTSDSDFFNYKLWVEKLDVVELKIKQYLITGKGVSLLNDSLYHALAELYGNIGRFEFYNCGNEKFNVDRLKLALKYSQRAVYFAIKTDDEKRASHWLARCGRILCRINQCDEAKNYIDAAEKILKRSTASEHQYKKRSEALKLEINIATGEIHLLKNESTEAIKYFILALEGAIYLQFSRIMAGSLYGLYPASQNGIEPVIEQLKSFKEQIDRVDREKIETLSDEDYSVFTSTSEFLKIAAKYTSDNDKKILRGELKKRAIDIWNSWAKSSGEDTLHFISKHMIEETFLSVIKS